jgi:hypothetical protein
MAAEVRGSTDTRAAPARWKPWARMAAAAIVLLLLSEALWLWQTWPVRELLHPATFTGTGA